MIRLLLAALILGLSVTAQAQTTKKSPGEMAAEGKRTEAGIHGAAKIRQ